MRTISTASRRLRSSSSTERSATTGAGTGVGGSASPTPPCSRSNRELRPAFATESVADAFGRRLSLDGQTYANSESVRRACEFLLSKQMEDGGWGESYKVRFLSPSRSSTHAASPVLRDESLRTQPGVSSRQHGFRRHRGFPSLFLRRRRLNPVRQTLVTARYHEVDPEPIRQGCQLIMARQLFDGSWAQESIEGGEWRLARRVPISLAFPLVPVFNRNCAISYPNFVSIMALLQAADLLRRERRADACTRNSLGVSVRSERLTRSLERLGGSCVCVLSLFAKGLG